MSAKVRSAALSGLDAIPVEVEADINPGLPKFTVVGLPDTMVQEARERVRSAIRQSGFLFPNRRVTVNLAPANVPKAGPAFDLPMSLAILSATRQIEPPSEHQCFVGELALGGELRPIRGTLSIADFVRSNKVKELYLPVANAPEAAIIGGFTIKPVPTLGRLVEHLFGRKKLKSYRAKVGSQPAEIIPPNQSIDLSEIHGQAFGKRALEISAAGGHNLLMTGPPGAGKTLLARALPSILPPLTFEESLAVTKIFSVAGLLDESTPLIRSRPFRHPHHTASAAAIVGGGRNPKPGEISLAHRGVLFLDELPEFPRLVLESLRQPLEEGSVTIARVAGSLSYPSAFLLVAARNPCPCGYAGDRERACVCPTNDRLRYEKRLSGPLLDRLDLFVTIPRLPVDELMTKQTGESSDRVRQRVQLARERQIERQPQTGVLTNAELSSRSIESLVSLNAPSQSLLRSAVDRLGLSARAYHRVLRVSRTIADLAGSSTVETEHVAEALQFRIS